MRRRWKSCVVKEVIEGRRVVGAAARKNLYVAYRGGTVQLCDVRSSPPKTAYSQNTLDCPSLSESVIFQIILEGMTSGERANS